MADRWGGESNVLIADYDFFRGLPATEYAHFYALSEKLAVPEPKPGPLRPGDANQDLSVDQLDIIQVSIAAKYLTGLPATWGEGDWDAAPGGSIGNPPANSTRRIIPIRGQERRQGNSRT